jgi:hypothetical protein
MCSGDSLMSRPIDRSEVIAFFTALRRRESPLAFWSHDTTNGQEKLIDGYVHTVTETLLEIENSGDETHTFVLLATVVEFIQLELNDAPTQIRTIAKDSYNFVLGFHAGKYACCVMAKDLRDTVAAK